MLTRAFPTWLCRLLVGATVLAGGCFSLDDPTGITSDDVLRVAVSRDALQVADGSTRIPVRAELVGDTPTGTELTFHTDAGTWVGADAASPKDLKIKSPSRIVDATLVAGVDPGIATIAVSAGGFTVRDTVTIRPAAPDTLQLTSDASKAPANGQNVVNLTARLLRAVGAGVPSRGTRVRFDVSTGGALQPELSSTVDSDSLGYARRTLSARAPGTYQVVARSGALADTLSIEFTAP